MNKPTIMKNINDIPALQYKGYLWYSDQERPQYIGEAPEMLAFSPDLLTKLEKDNSFVVEGALYCAEKNISISIRWAESKQDYIITQFDGELLKNEANYKCICHTWIVAKDSQRKAKMREVWTLQTDECTKDECKKNECTCTKWQSFRPAFWIFQGFTFA
jgi:CRISPR type III-associated protein (TIGR04423 family)